MKIYMGTKKIEAKTNVNDDVIDSMTKTNKFLIKGVLITCNISSILYRCCFIQI